jgi:hypothetical protein
MESIQSLLGFIGGPILTLFGWTHMQLSGLKTDLSAKAPISLLDREIGSVKTVIDLRNEHVCSRLEDVSGRISMLESKIDRLLECSK